MLSSVVINLPTAALLRIPMIIVENEYFLENNLEMESLSAIRIAK